MPTKRPGGNKVKVWHARATRQGVEYSLGYWQTLEEACAAEERFNITNPRPYVRPGKHQKRGTNAPLPGMEKVLD